MSAPITLAEVNAIVAKYGPMMRLHPAEKYMMDDPERMLGLGKCSLDSGLVQNETDYDSFALTMLSSTPIVAPMTLMKALAAAKQSPHAKDPGFRTWLHINDLLKPGDMTRARAQVCVHQGLDNDEVNIQFWFFYDFNGPGKFNVSAGAFLNDNVEMDTAGRHYGDWEHVTLRCVRAGGQWALHSVYLSRHTFTIWVSDLTQLQFVGTHPVIYVGRDSHAHYPTADKHVYETPWHMNFGAFTASVNLYDLTADGGVQFDTSLPGHHILIQSDFAAHKIAPPAWTGFPAPWGQYEKLIYSYDLKQAGVTFYTYNFKEVEDGPSGPLQHVPGGMASEWATSNMGQGPGAVSWLMADFNGDGRDEILQSFANGSSLGQIYYGSDGGGGIKQLWSSPNVGEGPGAVCWLKGDFKGAGKAVAVQGWSDGGSLGFILYGDNGSGGLHTTWSTRGMGDGTGAVSWNVGDFDGDGKDEILQGWSNGGTLGFIRYGGDGGDGLRKMWGTGDMGQGAGAVAWLVGDFNGDKKDELLQCWANGSSLGMIVYGDAGGGAMKTLFATGNMGEGPGAVSWLVGDFNGDGKDEVAQCWANGSSLGIILYGWDAPTNAMKVLWSTANMGQGPGAVSWQVGDYNGDGKQEILQCWANGTDLEIGRAHV